MPNPLELSTKIVDFVRRYGPILPVQISKEVGCNLLFAGAILSELVRTNKLKISSLKVGGSPVYYTEGQEEKLQNYSKFMNEMERKIVEILKEKKVLHDISLEPWQRVAIRETKDFAIMVRSLRNDIFWRWYLFNEKEADNIIESFYHPKEEKILEKEEPILEKTPIKEELKLELVPEKKTKGVIEKKKKEKKEKDTNLKEAIIEKEKVLEKHESIYLDFLNEYFNKKKIKILEENLIKKGKETDFVVNLVSEIGDINFFVKFKDKKKINDSDIILAQSISQSRKLPLLYLSKGEFTKKAKEYAEKNHIVIEMI